MDTPSTLAEIIDLASERHNGASGRRLAEIAQADGFTLSHATVNRLRRGDAGTVSQATIDALAHLARVDSAVVVRAADAASTGRPPEAIVRDYSRLNADLSRLEIEYAAVRNIAVVRAQAELATLAGVTPQGGTYPPLAHEKNRGRIPPPANDEERDQLLEFYGFTPAQLAKFNLGNGKVLVGFLMTVHTDALDRGQPDLWADTLIPGFDEQLKEVGTASVRGVGYLAAPAWVRRALARTGWVSPTMFQSPRPTALAVAEAERSLHYDPEGATYFVQSLDAPVGAEGSMGPDEKTIARLIESTIAEATAANRAAVENAKAIAGQGVVLPIGNLIAEYERHARLVRSLGPAEVGQLPFTVAVRYQSAFDNGSVLAAQTNKIEQSATGSRAWGQTANTVGNTITAQATIFESSLQVMRAFREAIDEGVAAFVASGAAPTPLPPRPPQPTTISGSAPRIVGERTRATAAEIGRSLSTPRRTTVNREPVASEAEVYTRTAADFEDIVSGYRLEAGDSTVDNVALDHTDIVETYRRYASLITALGPAAIMAHLPFEVAEPLLTGFAGIDRTLRAIRKIEAEVDWTQTVVSNTFAGQRRVLVVASETIERVQQIIVDGLASATGISPAEALAAARSSTRAPGADLRQLRNAIVHGAAVDVTTPARYAGPDLPVELAASAAWPDHRPVEAVDADRFQAWREAGEPADWMSYRSAKAPDRPTSTSELVSSVSDMQAEQLADEGRQAPDLTGNAHPDGPDRWPNGEPVYDEHWEQWKAWQGAGAPAGAWEAFRASDAQQAHELVARFVPGLTDAERRHEAQDRDAEGPDGEGPEGGA